MTDTSPPRVAWSEDGDILPSTPVEVSSPRVAAPADDDSISFIPPLPSPISSRDEASSPLEIDPGPRPGLPRQTIDIGTVQKITQDSVVVAPEEQSHRASIEDQSPVATSPNRQSSQDQSQEPPFVTDDASTEWNMVGRSGSENVSEAEVESYWRALQLLICFWKRWRKGRSPNEGRSQSPSAWRKFRATFRRKPPPRRESPDNGTQLAITFGASGGSNSERRGRSRRVRKNNNTAYLQNNSQRHAQAANPETDNGRSQSNNEIGGGVTSQEVSTEGIGVLLQQHRNRVSEGHHGQLRGPSAAPFQKHSTIGE